MGAGGQFAAPPPQRLARILDPCDRLLCRLDKTVRLLPEGLAHPVRDRLRLARRIVEPAGVFAQRVRDVADAPDCIERRRRDLLRPVLEVLAGGLDPRPDLPEARQDLVRLLANLQRRFGCRLGSLVRRRRQVLKLMAHAGRQFADPVGRRLGNPVELRGMRAHRLLAFLRPGTGELDRPLEPHRMRFEQFAQGLRLLGGTVCRVRKHVRLARQRLADYLDAAGRFLGRVGQTRHAAADLPRRFLEIGAAAHIGDEEPEEGGRRENSGEEPTEFVRQKGPERGPADIGGNVPETGDQPHNGHDRGETGRSTCKRRKNTPESVAHFPAIPVRSTAE